jgi:hypothetical protein
MSSHKRTLDSIRDGKQDNDIRFLDVVALLKSFGFMVRINGDHHIFYKSGIDEIINLQPTGSKAKAYQIRQVRNLITKYKLGEE